MDDTASFPGRADDERWAEQEVVRRVRLAPSRQWIEQYFDLIGRVIGTAELSAHDPRLSTTLPEARQKSPAIRVNINNRWVLVNHTRERGYRLGIIYGPEYEYQPHLREYIHAVWRFQPLFPEISTMAPTPFFLWLNEDLTGQLPDALQEGWLEAVRAEARRARGSVYRKHHQGVIYRAATDLTYRQRVLARAFSASEAQEGGS